MRLILPEKLIKDLFERSKKTPDAPRCSQADLFAALRHFLNMGGMKSINEEFYQAHIDDFRDDKTFRSALNRNGHKEAGAEEFLRDLICYYTYGLNWEDALKHLSLTEKEVEQETIRLRNLYKEAEIQKLYQIKLKESPQTVLSNIEYIDQKSFPFLALDGAEIQSLTLEFYTKFVSSPSLLKRIVSNNIYIEPPRKVAILENGELSDISIKDFIVNQSYVRPILIKILGEGGIGKTILMWHYIKIFCEEYTVIYIKKLQADIKKELLDTLLNLEDHKAVLFFVDEISKEANADYIELLGEFLSEYSHNAPFLLFVTGRTSLYDSMSNRKDFESWFSVVELKYQNNSIRPQIFVKVAECLKLKDILTHEKYVACYNSFVEPEFNSITDSIFNLLLEFKTIVPDQYLFPWEEWEILCQKKKKYFKRVFRIVAFFYQYGVSVPIYYLAECFNKDEEFVIDLREMLPLDKSSSPIFRWADSWGVELLALQDERIGAWYFKLLESELQTGKDILEKLLSNVCSKSSSYLFRNLYRKNREFAYSSFYTETSNDDKLKIINKYLASVPSDSYGYEEHKMLMEQHYVYVQNGDVDNAIKALEQSISISKNKNIHSITRLATYISNLNPARALLLFDQTLNEDTQNIKALFGKYNLYYKLNDLKYIEIEQLLFSKAINNPRLGSFIIIFIKYYLTKLQLSTLNNLKLLYTEQPQLCFELIELIIKKDELSSALELIKQSAINFKTLDFRSKNKIIDLLLMMRSKSKTNQTAYITLATDLIKNFTKVETEDIEYSFRLMKIECSSKKESDFKHSISLVDKILTTNVSRQLFLDTIRFYRLEVNNKRKYLETRKTNLLENGIAYIENRLKLATTDEIPYRLELCHFYVSLIKLTTIHKLDSKPFEESDNLNSLHDSFNSQLNICLTELQKRLRFVGKNPFYVYLIKDDDIRNFIKLCDIVFEYYKHSIKGLNKFDDKESLEVLKLQSLTFSILTEGFLLNKRNVSLILKYIELLIDYGDTQLYNLIETIDYSEFKIEDEIEMCRLFRRRGRLDIFNMLNTKFKYPFET